MIGFLTVRATREYSARDVYDQMADDASRIVCWRSICDLIA